MWTGTSLANSIQGDFSMAVVGPIVAQFAVAIKIPHGTV